MGEINGQSKKHLRQAIAVIMSLTLVLGLASLPENALAAQAKAAKTPFAQYGRLHVDGANLVDDDGKIVQLRGVSTHGIAWFPEYVNKKAFKTLRDSWGANAVRLAMYTAEYNGYCTGGSQNRVQQRRTLYQGIDAATELGMYVIVDWHILSDGNPNSHVKSAKTFFDKVSKKYRKQENVIYEICNEPNGGVTWGQIKTYAKKVIPVIRKNDPDAVIIVGTPTWSQEVDKAVKSPLKEENVMYALHFYAGTHQASLRKTMTEAAKAGLPIFVSEFSISDASGNGKLNKTQGKKWIAAMDRYHISYMNWSLCNKAESSALIKSSCKKTSGWKRTDLSSAGKWYVDVLQKKKD